MWTGLGIAAAGVGGALIGASAADKAANKQAAGTEKAVAETSRQYDQSRADLAPYRQAGTAALDRLRSLLGLTVGQSTATTGYIPQDQFDAQAYLKAYPDVAADPYYSQRPYEHYTKFSDRPGYAVGSTPSGDSTSSPLLRKFATEDLNADPVYQSGLQFGLDEGTKAIERRAAAGGGYDSGATLKGLVRFGNDYGSTKANESYGRFTSDQDRTFGKLTGIAGMGSGATNVGVNANANEATNLSNLYTGGANAQGAAAIAGGNALAGGVNNIGQYMMLRQLTGGGQRTTTPTVDPSVYQQG